MFFIVQTPGVKQFNGANPKGGSREWDAAHPREP